MTNLETLRTGIVGLGRAGWNQHFLPLLERPHFTITGVADPVEERRREAAAACGCATHASIDEMLASGRYDLVVVATPTPTHAEDARKAMVHGAACVLEKPIALSFAEAEGLVAASRESGRRLFVHHQHVFGRECALMQSILQGGRLGRLFHLAGYWANFNRRCDWQTLRKNGGGQLNNSFPHILSVVAKLLAPPFEVRYARIAAVKDAGDAEDYAHALLHAPGGVTVDLTCTNAAALSGMRWTLLGSHGAFQCNGKTGFLRYYEPESAGPLRVIDGAAPGRQYLLEKLTWIEEEFPLESIEIRPFYDNVEEVLLGRGEMAVTPESACEMMRVIGEIRRQSAVSPGGEEGAERVSPGPSAIMGRA